MSQTQLTEVVRDVESSAISVVQNDVDLRVELMDRKIDEVKRMLETKFKESGREVNHKMNEAKD